MNLTRRRWLAGLAALPGGLAHAQDAGRAQAVIDPIVTDLMARHAIPGMAVAVTLGSHVQVFNHGLASIASGAPVTDRTIFEIGSLSKTFTATLGAYAQATGKLSLSDHPSRFVPELRGTAIDRATLLKLATYTAGGLPLQFPDNVTPTHVMDFYRHWKPSFKLGGQRQYSNPSIGLFGLAASQALGLGFAEAMQGLVFPAFGMGSSFIDLPGSAMADYAWGYVGSTPVRVRPGAMDAQAYGVKTTAADLMRFVQAQITPSTLAVPMARAIQTTHTGHFRVGPMVQCLGWESYGHPASRQQLLDGNASDIIFKPQAAEAINPEDQPVSRLFNKTGSTNGFGAYALFVPAEQFGLVMLANKNYPIPARVEAAAAVLRQLTASA